MGKDNRTNMTLFGIGNAAGEFAPPFLIFPRKKVPDAVWDSVNTDMDPKSPYYKTSYSE